MNPYDEINKIKKRLEAVKEQVQAYNKQQTAKGLHKLETGIEPRRRCESCQQVSELHNYRLGWQGKCSTCEGSDWITFRNQREYKRDLGIEPLIESDWEAYLIERKLND